MSSRRTARAASCSRPTSPRPRSRFPASATSSTPALARVNRYSYRSKVEQLPIEPICAGSGEPAQGPLRARRRRHLHPALRRAGLRGAARVHRSGDPALVARRRDPAHEGAAPRRASRTSRSSIRRRGARSTTAIAARASSARSTTRNDLTPHRRELARLPLDPRVGRMILEAREPRVPARGAGHRAALGVQDVRDRPLEQQQAADEAHRSSTTRSRSSSATSSCGSGSGAVAGEGESRGPRGRPPAHAHRRRAASRKARATTS